MDRALNLGLLAGALDDTANLPTPNELRTMLADAEVAVFFRSDGDIEDALLEVAWNLHHVGTARPQLQIYEPARQVQANAVAAHIFDLALERQEMSLGERLVMSFAAQVSSLRGDRAPNATAIGRRLPLPAARLHAAPGRTSLELGCALLTLNRGETTRLLRELRQQTSSITGDIDRPESGLASALGVIEGVGQLQNYLTTGDHGSLESARTLFVAAANALSSRRDLDSRWVAAHLADLCDDFGTSSVWAVLPSDTPPGVGQAMTLGEPPVMTLWPPQVSVLADEDASPLKTEVKRAVLTFPTSAGKTLLSQLVIARHLAVAGTGVCFVAPSHSLCREVREGLDRRLWALRKFTVEDGPLGDSHGASAPVVVMTPEKLAARMRAGEQDLLNEFGLFVLDEAHLIDDETRGWTFESTVSRLHSITKDTDHRLILISAALGGTASVRTWLGIDSPMVSTSARWRGPRRLHATYTYAEDQNSRAVVAPTGKQRIPRTVTDLYGYVDLFVDEGSAVARGSAKLGQVVVAGTQKKQPSRAEKLLPIVEHASLSGPVLTVHATKVSAERMAHEVASSRADQEAPPALVRLAEERLGGDHGLVKVLRRGVAYHHAALPVDIQAEIEDGVRSGAIDVVCATTTLTEGINLPVRTVIVSERGYYDGAEYHTFIDAAGLMNAAGRAGRAGRETEGWVILNYEYGAPNPRRALADLDRHHDIQSRLNLDEALEELGEYEALIHATAALVLENVPASVDGFLAYCWYLADVADVIDPNDRREKVIEGIRGTLAWHQLPADIRERWEALASVVAASYELAEPTRRRRWARSGAKLSANAVLESVALSLTTDAAPLDELVAADPTRALEVVLGGGRLEQLLGLADPRDYRFKRRRYGAIDLVDVDLRALILDWVRGASLNELVEAHLSEVDSGDDGSFSFEQLSGFLARVCEHHLPFTLGTVLEWVNAERSNPLCPALPAHVHFGVPAPESVELLTHGVRSRRLAVAVGTDASASEISVSDLRSWLTDLGASHWRTAFAAGPSEVGDLLRFVHDPAAPIGSVLLGGDAVDIPVDSDRDRWPGSEELPVVVSADDEPPQPLVVVDSEGDVAAHIRAAEHRHLALLVDVGFQLLATPVTIVENRVTEVRVRAEIE